jgi:hypothetical protein
VLRLSPLRPDPPIGEERWVVLAKHGERRESIQRLVRQWPRESATEERVKDRPRSRIKQAIRGQFEVDYTVVEPARQHNPALRVLWINHNSHLHARNNIVDKPNLTQARDRVSNRLGTKVCDDRHVRKVEGCPPCVYIKGKRLWVGGPPRLPSGQRRRYNVKATSLEWPNDRLTERLAPNRTRFVVPPGHRITPQGALVSEDDLLPVEFPAMNYRRTAAWSPTDEDRLPIEFIDDHLTLVEVRDRVRLLCLGALNTKDQHAIGPVDLIR